MKATTAAMITASDDNDAVALIPLIPVDDDDDDDTPVDDDDDDEDDDEDGYGTERADTPMTPRAMRPPALPTELVSLFGLPSSRNVCNTTPRPMIEPMPWKVNKSNDCVW